MTTQSQTIRVDQLLNITVSNFKDVAGNPVSGPLANPVTWTVDNAALGTVTPGADGMTAVFTPAGPLGLAKVMASTDTDPGTGVITVTEEVDVTVVAGLAVAMTLDVAVADNTAIDQPAA
jgi:hypothetical protein